MLVSNAAWQSQERVNPYGTSIILDMTWKEDTPAFLAITWAPSLSQTWPPHSDASLYEARRSDAASRKRCMSSALSPSAAATDPLPGADNSGNSLGVRLSLLAPTSASSTARPACDAAGRGGKRTGCFDATPAPVTLGAGMLHCMRLPPTCKAGASSGGAGRDFGTQLRGFSSDTADVAVADVVFDQAGAVPASAGG